MAAFGLVVAPLVHAERHAREHPVSPREALAAVFAIGFDRARSPEQDSVLRDALERAFGPAGVRDPGGRDSHGHSHGPGRHGAGSLEHFDVAVHRPPPPPALLPRAPVPVGQLLAYVSLFLTPRFSTPECSQAPPKA